MNHDPALPARVIWSRTIAVASLLALITLGILNTLYCWNDVLISLLVLQQKRGLAADLKNRLATEQRRLEISREGINSQIAPQESDVNQRRATWDLRRKQLDELNVRAGMSGILQLVPVERGSQVSPGANLARVANPSNLKAELRIAETQTKDIRIGQYAEVDTRNGVVKGHVSRMDPSSVGGTVGVDVIMDGPLHDSEGSATTGRAIPNPKAGGHVSSLPSRPIIGGPPAPCRFVCRADEIRAPATSSLRTAGQARDRERRRGRGH
jgi:hypothetical protein